MNHTHYQWTAEQQYLWNSWYYFRTSLRAISAKCFFLVFFCTHSGFHLQLTKQSPSFLSQMVAPAFQILFWLKKAYYPKAWQNHAASHGLHVAFAGLCGRWIRSGRVSISRICRIYHISSTGKGTALSVCKIYFVNRKKRPCMYITLYHCVYSQSTKYMNYLYTIIQYSIILCNVMLTSQEQMSLNYTCNSIYSRVV